MDVEGDVHHGGACAGRGVLTAERAPEAPDRGWSGWSVQLGRVDEWASVPGVCTRAQPMRNVYIWPYSAEQCQTVPECA